MIPMKDCKINIKVVLTIWICEETWVWVYR